MEETDQGVTARSSVQPQRDRIIRRISSRLKEPEKGVNIRRQVNEAGVGIDSWCCFADTCLAWLLVSDRHIVWRCDGGDTRWVKRKLSCELAEFWSVDWTGLSAG